MHRLTLPTVQLEKLRHICDKAGIKLTQQRLEIFKVMISASNHPSAEHIHKKMQQTMPTIALDTVYRTLATFDELGIVKKLHLMGERALFDGNLSQHHHFVCIRCKTVQDVYWPEFDTATLPGETGSIGEVRSRHLELRGICQNCLKKAEKNKHEQTNSPA
ncbi:MAG: transcriptional repressor [Desulfocapsa sp.]|nr:MAG: transcriptional repressor [Desulfocapsa sp.]